MKVLSSISFLLLVSILSFGQANQYSQPASANFRNTYAPTDFNTLNRVAEAAHANKLRNEQIQKEKIKNLINQVKSFYSSVPTFPEKINDGWHKVISTNNYDFCEERKVYVLNNKVVRYVIDDWIDRKVSYHSVIFNAKSMIQLIEDDRPNSELLELYFIEYLSNPNGYVSPPVKSGKVSFWTNIKRGNTISVYIENEYIGEIDTYFSEDHKLNCGENGTLVFEYKPGTYNYRASDNKHSWSGKITITSGNCSLIGLRQR